jgi:hypothetical protein
MKYKGSCHCGKVKFEFDGEVTEGMTCNCSRCHITGTVLHFLPKESVKVEGLENMTTYRFNKNIIAHMFCSTCGVQPFGMANNNGKDMMAINLRAVPEIDLDKIKINKYNGKDL